jgi:hypothetical protein
MQEIPQVIIEPHVVIAILCIVGAGLIAAALVIWLAIENEMRGKK